MRLLMRVNARHGYIMALYDQLIFALKFHASWLVSLELNVRYHQNSNAVLASPVRRSDSARSMFIRIVPSVIFCTSYLPNIRNSI